MSRFESNTDAAGDRTEEQVVMAGTEARALRRLVGEIRQAEPPELDWERVEQSLMERIAQERAATVRPHKSGPSWGPLAGFAAAAAALIMMISQGSQQQLAAPVQAAPRAVNVSALTPLKDHPGELPTYDAAEIGTSAMVTSGNEPLRFEVKGVATWVLEPNSRAVVRGAQAPYLVELQQGALHAEVVPRKSNTEVLETFAVEVGDTRVAVHGTVFTVQRHGDDSTSVEVTRGAVTIGPGGHQGITTGHLLVGPARALFSLDGAKQARMLPMSNEPIAVALGPGHPGAGQHGAGQPGTGHPGTLHEPSHSGDGAAQDPAAHGDAAPPRAVDAAGSPAPAQPGTDDKPAADEPKGDEPAQDAQDADKQPDTTEKPAEPKALTVAQAQSLVVGCLSQVMNSNLSDDTMLLVSSRVTVKLDGEGTVSSMRFVPPLKASLQSACSAPLWGKKIQGGPQVSFDVHVSRR